MPRSPFDDYYALLSVDTDADEAELRRAWRRLALRWHPDHAGADTTVIFQKLQAAYEVLSDPIARKKYDREHAIKPKPRPAPPPAEPARRRAPGVMLSRLSRSLDILLAMGVARRSGDDVIELVLDEDEATQGGMVTISMRVPVRCPACTTGCAACESRGTVEDLFAAWLAVPPGVTDGVELQPSALLPGMRPVSFRVRVA